MGGQEIRVLDYLEGQGQVLGYYTNELHHRGYKKAICYLPHDGVMRTWSQYSDSRTTCEMPSSKSR